MQKRRAAAICGRRDTVCASISWPPLPMSWVPYLVRLQRRLCSPTPLDLSCAALTLLIVETYNDFVRFHGTVSSSWGYVPLILTRMCSVPISSAHYTASHLAHLGFAPAIPCLPPHHLHPFAHHTVLVHGVRSVCIRLFQRRPF